MEQDTNAATERRKKKAEEESTELTIEELTFKCLHHVIFGLVLSSPLHSLWCPFHNGQLRLATNRKCLSNCCHPH